MGGLNACPANMAAARSLTNWFRLTDGATCVPHSPYFGPGYLATLHILAAKAKEVALERFFCDLAHVPYGANVPIENGWVQIPDLPGLGPDPDEELMRFRV